MKYCKTCGTEKSLQEFPKHRGHSDGLASNCKTCCREKSKNYREENPEKAKSAVDKCHKDNKEQYAERKKVYSKEHSAEAVERARKWSYENPELVRKYRNEWKKRNKGKVNADTASRRARLRNASPDWLSEEDKTSLAEIYQEASDKTSMFGLVFHVDHIVPLNSEKVCGLHVPWNLRVVLAEDNLRKSNKILEEINA